MLRSSPLRSFGTVFGTSLIATFDTQSIQSTTNNMVTDTWQIFHSATANQDNGVLLEVVTFTTDVGDDFFTIGKTDLSYLTKR